MVLLPALGSQAGKVGLAGPCTTGARGIQPIATNQAGAGVREVLQDLDKELWAGNSFESVWKYGLYSERYRTLSACSSTSIFCSDTGGRAMYCARASRAPWRRWRGS